MSIEDIFCFFGVHRHKGRDIYMNPPFKWFTICYNCDKHWVDEDQLRGDK